MLLMTITNGLLERVSCFERYIFTSRHINHLTGILAGDRSHLPGDQDDVAARIDESGLSVHHALKTHNSV